ncbi:hypothetical protein [Pseudorhodoplanes sp.]|uniref:hypothetical protein n=1 Tax=Pseudorhodoplanes sp. TaxID=1934341 RepID=UPI002C5BFD03|nr:hypothetical protein [Pseudorhodoplanes sp.]HWV51318.1 hypothetical protein [Pseudorhodoplanes sp.]
MKKDVNRLLRGHRANIDRYAKLLATNLTELERQYIHRRIAEEHAAIARLEAERFLPIATATADPATLIAARQAAGRQKGGGSGDARRAFSLTAGARANG